MRRTKEQAAQTRQQIVTVAERLFATRGYDEVKLEDVAAEAGVTRGAIGWHFTNKQGLLYAIRDHATRPLQQLALRLMENATSSPIDMLGHTICEMFDELQRHEEEQRSLVKATIRVDMLYDASGSHLEWHDAIIQILTAAARVTKFKAPWTPDMAASALSALINGILHEWAFERSDFRLLPYGDELIRVTLMSFIED